MILYGSSKLFRRIKLLRYVMNYVGERVASERDLILRLYSKLYDMFLGSYTKDEHDRALEKLYEMGFRMPPTDTWGVSFEKDGFSVKISIYFDNLVSVDEWLLLDVKPNGGVSFRRTFMDYCDAVKLTNLLRYLDYDPDRLAEWYVSAIREALGAVETVDSEVRGNVDPAVSVDECKRAIIECVRKNIAPHYSYVLKLVRKAKRELDLELANITWDWFISTIRKALEYDDGEYKVSIANTVDSVAIDYYNCNMIVAQISVAYFEPEMTTMYIYMQGPLLGKRMLWLRRYIENRAPRVHHALREGKRMLNAIVRDIDRAIRAYPEFFLLIK